MDIFRKTEDYPLLKESNDKFILFLNTYNNIFKYYDISLNEITDVIDKINEPNVNVPILKDTEKNNFIIVKIIYRIFTSYYNYLSYLTSDNEIKNYNYVLPIFTSPRKWLTFNS